MSDLNQPGVADGVEGDDEPDVPKGDGSDGEIEGAPTPEPGGLGRLPLPPD